jgi:hypothetical protein
MTSYPKVPRLIKSLRGYVPSSGAGWQSSREALDIIVKAWTEGSATYEGKD